MMYYITYVSISIYNIISIHSIHSIHYKIKAFENPMEIEKTPHIENPPDFSTIQSPPRTLLLSME